MSGSYTHVFFQEILKFKEVPYSIYEIIAENEFDFTLLGNESRNYGIIYSDRVSSLLI
jgi:hypothetical protein